MEENQKCFQVIIIGGGLAGLSAAVCLLEHGIDDFVVLEAQHRVGGRIHTVGQNKRPLELGAQWIHGACTANSVYNLANKLKLVGEDVQRLHDSELGEALKRWPLTPGYILRPDGFPLTEEATEQAYEIFNSVAEEAEKVGQLHHKADGQSSRLSTFYNGRKKRALDALKKNNNSSCSNGLTGTGHCEVELALNGLARALSIEAGDDLSKVRLEAFGTASRLPGGSVSLPQGAGELTGKLKQLLPPRAVKLGHEVTHIDWSLLTRNPRLPDKVSVEVCRRLGESWTTKTNTTFYADYVLCTLPLGVLKRNHQKLFHPRLGETKRRAIEDMGMGQVSKMYFEWSAPWWAPGEGGIQLAWPSQTENHSINKTEQVSSEDQRHWYRGLCNFSEVDSQPNMLCSWVAGQNAAIADNLDDEEVILTVTDVLRRFTGDPGLAAPFKVHRHKWTTDPYSLGSWSYHALTTSDADPVSLARPLPSESDPRLLFAGEATDHRFLGTLLAARLSGLREARRILDNMDSVDKLAAEMNKISATTPNGKLYLKSYH